MAADKFSEQNKTRWINQWLLFNVIVNRDLPSEDQRWSSSLSNAVTDVYLNREDDDDDDQSDYLFSITSVSSLLKWEVMCIT